MITLLAGGSVLPLVASVNQAQGATPAEAAAAACAEVPSETEGPYPADGSNGPNVLTQSGIVRQDIRPSFGTASGVADGVPLTIELTVVEAADDCGTPLSGAAVYVWHCDRLGNYSLYSPGAANENYLRGVQETDENGTVSFTSIFPACYAGRWPHVHFEIYPSLQEATSAGSILKTSQLALPEDVCDTVYDSAGYDGSIANFSRVSLSTDMVFRDGVSLQLATVTGSLPSGYTAALRVAV
ncbi:hypothetical protein D7294_18835 [Streptomyces hoynatensis]|uniref:Intradiol ring-cleavage dioxygenases domain-containing protein n=2 Tax=Streptomyces hoynatensis TaxID=1141874 RepID=A0A3A9YWR9_9ACTN|nr:hypothetical protein D7294_18835 [Streptomyces hoynatensis]